MARNGPGILAVAALAVAIGCVGEIGENDPETVPPSGGTTTTATSTCTSGTTWSAGNEGSPAMNPGRACINCHASGEGPRFSIAGTLYPTAHEPDLCYGVDGAQVTITGADGQTLTLTPNAAGNFYSEVPVTTPYAAKIVFMGRERMMAAHQTTGDCNGCHTQAGANGAPGRIVLP